MELIRPERALYWEDIVYEIQEVLKDTPEVYFVGGMVRDAYRGQPFKDIDLACPKDGRPVARQIANAFNGDYYTLDAERGVGRAIFQFQGQRWIVDAAAFRGDDLLSDLRDRDFTVNAMAVAVNSDLEGIYDPLGGISDLTEKILRRCSPTSLSDDPIRALRAIRQSIAYSLKLEPETKEDVRQHGQRIFESSPERVRDEFFAILNGNKPQAGLMALDALGLLRLIVPEVEALKSVQQTADMNRWRYVLLLIEKLSHLLTVISPRRDDNTAASAGFGTFVYMLDKFRGFMQAHTEQKWANERNHRMLLIFATLLLYSTEKPEQAEERATALRLSGDEIKRLEALVNLYRIPRQLHEQTPLDNRTIYRFWRAAGEAGIDACLLSVADYLSSAGVVLDVPKWTFFLQTIGQLLGGYKAAMEITPLVSGNDLMTALNLQPGPQIGMLLETLREAQALGEITTPDSAIELARKTLENQ